MLSSGGTAISVLKQRKLQYNDAYMLRSFSLSTQKVIIIGRNLLIFLCLKEMMIHIVDIVSGYL